MSEPRLEDDYASGLIDNDDNTAECVECDKEFELRWRGDKWCQECRDKDL